MFTKEILEAVKIGILTDEQLKIAIKHYRILNAALRVHGESYHFVWRDVFDKLEMLEGFTRKRQEKGRCADIK